MTDQEKTIVDELYDASDQILVSQRRRCREILGKLNSTLQIDDESGIVA